MRLDQGALFSRASTDPELLWKLRGFDGTVRIGLGQQMIDLIIEGGSLIALGNGEGDATVTLAESAEFWDNALMSKPERGYEKFFFNLKGDWIKDVAPYVGAWMRLFHIVRETANGRSLEIPGITDPFIDSDDPVGRYVRYSVDGTEYRVYYETAGSGPIPVLLLHTAGADARQWRHLLADPELQRRYTLVALDLPYHGKSIPPTTARWWEGKMVFTKEILEGWIVGFIDAISLDRPIFVGCSVGGQLASDLCADHPEKIRGAVGINGLYHMDNFDKFDNDMFRDPRVPAELFGTMNFGATSLFGPEPFRRELYWIYKANFPGVYAADNEYFMHGHDLRKNGHLIDTTKTPLTILNGEYDLSQGAPDAGGQKIAEMIPGVKYRTMIGQSHFAPTDDPLGFREWLIPALDEVAADSTPT
ncbi:Pimeloyl-ACP methyl ester carboxylesterase [Variovorax sp. HW608]|uniref:alpha/beta fold hydrolase n=1 Tax=Variovorax sp. HW608 TaxID=1034889 RepID=UPI00081FC287|nr:alpha/beta hydrolase [Variovorax sp. HW608]SCK42693.1 Pimeloyl-ACP methyl ester carboxylesterase [Variovorax sp. HW608]